MNHVKYGLKPYFLTRNNSIKQQISHNNIIPVLQREKHIPVMASVNTGLKFSIDAYDDDHPVTVKIWYTYNAAAGFMSATMSDDGLHDDGMANDGIFGFSLPAHNTIDTLEFYYTGVSVTNQLTRYPSVNNLLLPIGVKSNLKIRINELMAKNSITIKDEWGEYDDWLEIYSYENTGISLSSLYLSNSMSNPFKFRLPAFTLFPNSFKLFWCDNQTSQGATHTNFKLNAGGEWVCLFDNYGLLIDSISYTNSGDDISIGRNVDGTGSFGLLSNRTPGYTNTGFSYGLKKRGEEMLISIYPDPHKLKNRFPRAQTKYQFLFQSHPLSLQR